MKMKKNRKLKGSVLLTVVFVMAILIVFLFGTMSLAIAASNRSHVNYSSAQTSVTARTVAESAIMALANSSDEGAEYAKAVCALEKNMSQTVNVRISQGGSDVSGIGDISQVTIEHVGSTQFFDPTSQKWEPRDVLKFTANVEMGGVMSTSSVYVVKHLEQDKITTAGGGAGFVTTAGAFLKTQTSIYGGAYISLPEIDWAKEYDYSDDYDARMATRTFRMNKAEPGQNAVYEDDFLLDNSDAVIEADLYVNNDMCLNDWSGVVFPGEKTGITVLGDLTFTTNAKDHFKYIMADENNKFKAAEGETPNTVNFTSMPYVYVDGKISGGTIVLGNKGEQDFPLNTFCGSISTLKADGTPLTSDNIIINSNLYCMDKDATSYIVSQNPSKLLQFADSTFNQTAPERTEEISGEICSNGNLVLRDVEIKGDVRVAGKLTINGIVTVNGNVVAKDIEEAEGARLICNNGTIYRDDPTDDNSVTIDLNIPNKVGYFYDYKPTPNTTEDGSVYVGIDGEPLNDSYFDNGILRDGKDNVPKIYYTMAENNHAFMVEVGQKPALHSGQNGELIENTHYFYEDSADYDKFAIANDLAKSALESDFKTELDDGAVVYGFYYETTGIKNFQPAAAVLPEGYEKATGNDGNEYMFQREVNYSRKIEDTNPTVAVQGEITNNINTTSVYLEAKGEKTIYPVYALRDAVLGLKGYTETKIVKTIEEIVTEVNPYNPSDMPTELTAEAYAKNELTVYDSAKTYAEANGILVASDGKLPTDYPATIKSEENTIKLNGRNFYKVTKANYANCATKWDDLFTGTSEDVATYITKDCVLNFNPNTHTYIDPADKNIIIGIKNAAFPSDSKIYVNDAGGGKVYFYIESGGKLGFDKTALLTTSYWKFFNDHSKVSFESTKSGVKPIEEMGDKMKPNVFIFGASGSNMSLINTRLITAYIKSPNIKTTVSGNEPFPGLAELYYHNYEVLQHAGPCIIGCFNVQDVTSDNPVNSIFIPQNKKNSDDIIIQVGEHWFVPYYYSEF